MKFNTCLSEISEIVMGQSPKGDEVNNCGKGVPLLNGPTEFTDRYPEPVQFTESGKKFAEKGDILFCVRGSTTGRMNYADQKYAIGRGIGAIRGRNGFPTPYVRAVIEQNLDRLLQAATGSTFPNVGRDMLNNFEVASVGQEDANRINQFIVSLEGKVYLNSQINQTLEQMAQAIFKSWFVDFEPVKAKIAALEAGGSEEDALLAAMQAISGKGEAELTRLEAEQPEQYAELRATAELFPSAMQDSELGEIPEGWAIAPFSSIARLDTTSVKPAQDPEKIWEHYSIPAFDEGATPVFETGVDIKSNKYKVYPTAVLSSKLNPHFPRTWIPYVQSPDAAICSTEFMQFVPIEPQHRAFIAGTITSEPFQNGIMMRVTGSTGSRQRAQPKQVAAMDVILPKSELRAVYSKQTEAMYRMQSKNIWQARSLSSLRDTLLPKLLSGELSVLDAEGQLEEAAEPANV